MFIQNPEGKFLFYKRLMFPFAVTVPAGHIDTGEDPPTAARRETMEEVVYKSEACIKIGTDDIVGDSCRRGSNVHRRHTYLVPTDKMLDLEVTEKDEGHKPMWPTLDEALTKDLTYPYGI